MRLRAAAVVTALLAAACGGSSSSEKGPDANAYAGLAQDISTKATTYATAADVTPDVPSCQAGHTAYDGEARPMVVQMQGMSGDMDRQMTMMGSAADADMTCGADAMRAELDHHAAVACTSTTMADNHAEANRHAAAMVDWAAHQHARAEEMGGMMGTMGMGGGATTTTCHRNADGTFTLGP